MKGYKSNFLSSKHINLRKKFVSPSIPSVASIYRVKYVRT